MRWRGANVDERASRTAGRRTNPGGKSVSNKIVLSIPDHEYASLRPDLEFVNLPHHLVLHEPAEKLEFAYFLNGGLAPLVVATQVLHRNQPIKYTRGEVRILNRKKLEGCACECYRVIQQLSELRAK